MAPHGCGHAGVQEESAAAARTDSGGFKLRLPVSPPGGAEGGSCHWGQRLSVLLVPQSLESLIQAAAGARSAVTRGVRGNRCSQGGVGGE